MGFKEKLFSKRALLPLTATAVAFTLWYGYLFLPRSFVLNTSASMPRGIYRVFSADTVFPGDILLIERPATLRALRTKYPWMDSDFPLLKRVGAVPGDRVCISEKEIAINGTAVGRVHKTDSQGLELPHIYGCHTVLPGHFLPLGDPRADTSFDGRYFGELPVGLILGKARPVYLF